MSIYPPLYDYETVDCFKQFLTNKERRALVLNSTQINTSEEVQYEKEHNRSQKHEKPSGNRASFLI